MAKKGEHTRTPVTISQLRDYGVRLKAAAQAYENAAQTLEASRFESAIVRNIPQLDSAITKVENSAGKVGLDVARSISQYEIDERAKANAKTAIESIREANKKPKEKG